MSRSAPTMPTTRPMPVRSLPCPRTMPSTAAARAERHADADLVCALRHQVRQDAVGADRGDSSATPATRVSSCAMNRGRATDSANTSSIVRSLTIGSVGIRATARPGEIVGASESNGISRGRRCSCCPGREFPSRTARARRPPVPSLIDAALLHVLEHADDREPRRFGMSPPA